MGTRMGPIERDGDTIVWEYRIPLLTNPFLVWDLVRVVLIGLVVMTVSVALMGLVAGEGLVLLPPVAYLIGGGTVLALFAVSMLLLGNGYWATFGVTDKGVTYGSGSRGRALNRLTAVAGVLAGSPGTAGAGLLAISRENVRSDWRDIRKVVVYRRARVIVVRDSWHAVQRLHCAELLDEAVVAIRANWGAAGGAVEVVER